MNILLGGYLNPIWRIGANGQICFRSFMEVERSAGAMPGSLGELKALGGQVLARRKPWARMVEPKRFAAPQNAADMNKRLRRNLEDFQANYAVFLAGVLAISLLFNPVRTSRAARERGSIALSPTGAGYAPDTRSAALALRPNEPRGFAARFD